MQVEELFDLTNWIQNEIVDSNIPTLYQNLYQILIINSQPNQQKQPFEDQKISVIKALTAVPLSTLSTGQLEILAKIGIANHVGQVGVDFLEEILFRNALDIATAAQKVNATIQELNAGIQWATQTGRDLATIIHTEAVMDTGESILLRVHFQKNAHLSNLTEFKDWGKIWWDIGRGISMAHGASPEDIQVVGASKGSIIITLMTSYGIAKTTSLIILEALKVAEKILDIRKKVLEIQALKLSNDLAVKQLENDVKEEKKKGVENITTRTVEALGLKAEGEGEKVKALDTAIKKLVDFVEKGGEVDFIIPDEVESDDEEEQQSDPMRQSRDELRVIFKEVRLIEEKVKQLEFKKED